MQAAYARLARRQPIPSAACPRSHAHDSRPIARALALSRATAQVLGRRSSRWRGVASRSPRRLDRSSRFEPHYQPHYQPHRLASDTEASSAEAGG
ncbi:hypothetical protein, partial [Burkholderia pseudomallei]|uniref:hypothetical protein n=1 Tax=Burkholderia pseudomallei TaxID=28450 RepID=UPI001C4AEDB3